MDPGVKDQAVAAPEATEQAKAHSDKESNFRRLEAAREVDRERALRAELENQMLKREMENIKTMLTPAEKDPLDDVQDMSDPDQVRKAFKTALARNESRFKKEAEEVADRKIEQKFKEREDANFLGRLKSQYTDYDSVMNDASLEKLSKTNPEFLEAAMQIPDDYARRKLVYAHLKTNKPVAEERQSIKEIVDENKRNPFFIPSGSGAPSAVDYDLKSPKARDEAYAKLKAAQRRPINSGPAR